MATSAIQTYTGGGLMPIITPESARMLSIQLAANTTYASGTVLGQIEGTGTAVNEVQTLTATGTVSGGTYRLQIDGYTTSSLAYNASNATIQAALEALPNIGTGNIAVGGGAFPGTPATFTFQGSCAGLAFPVITVISSVTGGGSIAMARTTAGKPAKGYFDAYDNSASGDFAGLSTAKCLIKYASRTDAYGRIWPGTSVGASDNGAFDWTTPAYFSGYFATGDGSALLLTGLDSNGVTDLGRLTAGATLTAAETIICVTGN